MQINCSKCGTSHQVADAFVAAKMRCKQCNTPLSPAPSGFEEQVAGGQTQLLQIPRQLLEQSMEQGSEAHNATTQVQHRLNVSGQDQFNDNATQMLQVPQAILEQQKIKSNAPPHVKPQLNTQQSIQQLGQRVRSEITHLAGDEDFQGGGTQAISPSTRVLRHERRQSRWRLISQHLWLFSNTTLVLLLLLTMPYLYQNYIAGWLEGKIALDMSQEIVNGVQLAHVAAFVATSPTFEPMLVVHGKAQIAPESEGFLPTLHLHLQRHTLDGGAIVEQPFGVWLANDILPMLEDKIMYQRWLSNLQPSPIPAGQRMASFALQVPLLDIASLERLTIRLVPAKSSSIPSGPALALPAKVEKQIQPSERSKEKLGRSPQLQKGKSVGKGGKGKDK